MDTRVSMVIYTKLIKLSEWQANPGSYNINSSNYITYNSHTVLHSQKYTDCIGSVQILYRSRKYRPILDFWAII